MKTLQLLCLIVIAALALACESNTDESAAEGTVECLLDGQLWQAKNVTALQDFEKLTIVGSDGKDSDIGLYIPNSKLKSGTTFPLTDTGNGIIVSANNFTKAGSGDYYVKEGTMTITNASSNKAEGTFSFKGTNNGVTLNITQGKFSVVY
jgi:hypothetical protein